MPGPVRRLFSYDVPESLRQRCAPGARVLVPFGRRRLTGYVVAVADAVTGEGAVRRRKPIEDVLDDEPALDAELLELTRWAADYYAASRGDLIQAALPGVRARLRAEVGITSAGVLLLESGRATPAVRPFLRALLTASGAADRHLPLEEARRKAGVPLPVDRLKALARRGLVDWREVLRDPGTEGRRETWVLPAAPASAAADAGPAAPRGRLQTAALAFLRARPEGATVAEVVEATGATRATLVPLARRGLVTLLERDAPRTPLALRAPPSAAEPITPTPEQAAAIATLEEAVAAGRHQTCLLLGVTGSGKTEVYLRAIEATLGRGRPAIYLVPEIGLTPLLARRLQARFGEALALMHSGLSEGERRDEWRRIRAGQVKVVLGARSALFAPIGSPGLVVVDEEHDASYKQEEAPRYHARDLAVVRARQAGGVALLGTATPSMESYQNALAGKYRLLTLTGRPGGATLPVVHRVDMRREFEAIGREPVLSRPLHQAIADRLARREQTLILLNRRGFSTFAQCRACGESIECRDCSIAMTLHRSAALLRCHYCNAARAVPAACPACGSGHLHYGGTGTERLEATMQSLFPNARVARMDRDTMRGRGVLEALLDQVDRGDIDILMGTQMIAKGHDFAGVTLVGVLAADALLGLPDFRAGERAFQLLTQVAGRSGRRDTPGEVIVQAWDPEHHAVRAACEQNYEAFARAELAYRRSLRYPPFAALALLVFRDPVFESAAARAGACAAALRRLRIDGLNVLGPAPAPLERLRGEYRVQVMLKGARRAVVRQAVDAAATHLERTGARSDQVTIDVDPASTL
ncbi:MAG TPA: primosomal protein N' [Dongiaceae bacterium]|nr:primosomal protein N' [Dongiaceae bacterium]